MIVEAPTYPELNNYLSLETYQAACYAWVMSREAMSKAQLDNLPRFPSLRFIVASLWLPPYPELDKSMAPDMALVRNLCRTARKELYRVASAAVRHSPASSAAIYRQREILSEHLRVVQGRWEKHVLYYRTLGKRTSTMLDADDVCLAWRGEAIPE